MMVHDDDDVPPEKYGTALTHDPQFQGPCKSRSCTDVIFLLLFIAFLTAWGFVGFFAYTHGKPQTLFTPVDSQGRRCGKDSEVLDKPYLFFFDLSKCATPKVLLSGCDTPQICVKQCPMQNWASLPYRTGVMTFNPSNVQRDIICQESVDKYSIANAAQLWQLIEEEKCAEWYVSSKPVFGRCLPAHDDLAKYQGFVKTAGLKHDDAIEQLINSTQQITSLSVNEVGGKVLDDLMKSWRAIILALIIAVIISLFYIALLRWMAGIMTWLSLIAIIALMATAGVFCWKRYAFLRDNGPIRVKGKMLEGQFEEIGNSKELFLTLTIIISVITVVALLVIVFLRKRIQVAITLIKEGSKAVSNVISSLFFPIIPWCFQIVVGVWVLFVWVHLQSLGEQLFKVSGYDGSQCRCNGPYERIKNGDLCMPSDFAKMCHNLTTGEACSSATCEFFKMDQPTYVSYFHIYNVFGFFWGIWFLSGLSDMILAGTFAKWYWTFKKKDVPFFAVTTSALRTVRYHLGTVAFGSLIISICSFIRAVIEYIEKKTKAYENVVVKAIFCCLKCFFWCLEKFLRFINRNAYIMCAIHGRNFCLSAKDAFNLLMRNIIRVVVLDKVTDFLFFIGKIVITGCVAGGAYFLFFQNNPHHLNYEGAVPLTLICIGAYIIASIFFGVYAMAVDTLFLCFLEDCERNDGSIERPYFMSKNLMQILGKKNKKQR